MVLSEPHPAQLLTGANVAELLGTTPRTVRHYAEVGRLPRVVLGRRSTRYRLADVLELIDSSTTTGPATNRARRERHIARAHETP